MICKSIGRRSSRQVQSNILNYLDKFRSCQRWVVSKIKIFQPESGPVYNLTTFACTSSYTSYVKMYALQMKGRWESNIIVWFPLMYSQKWNCYFQNRIIMFCLPVPTIYLWEIYIFPGLVCLFCWKIWDRSWGNIYIAHRHMNVEIRTEAAQFLEEEYINGIFVAVWAGLAVSLSRLMCRE
jgi:hypothetical protein